jgi:hypothetical protein
MKAGFPMGCWVLIGPALDCGIKKSIDRAYCRYYLFLITDQSYKGDMPCGIKDEQSLLVFAS